MDSAGITKWLDTEAVTSSNKLHKFILIFDKATGSPRITYYLLDPDTDKLIPKPSSLTWKRLKDITGYKPVVLDHYLFIIGGKHWETGEYLNIVYRYDTRYGTWSNQAPLSKGKTRFSANVLNGKILVAGGEVNGCRITNAVEIYDPVLDSWSHGPALPAPRADHAAVVLDDMVYVTGGIGGLKQGATNTFWRLNTVNNTWTEANDLNCMIEVRERHAMIARSGRLFVAGGIGRDPATLKQRDIGVPEYFNVKRNDLQSKVEGWSDEFGMMMYPRSNFGSVLIGHRVYAFGGYNSRKSEECRVMEYLHLGKRRWVGGLRLPEASYVHTDAVLLSVPQSNSEFSTLALAMYKRFVLW